MKEELTAEELRSNTIIMHGKIMHSWKFVNACPICEKIDLRFNNLKGKKTIIKKCDNCPKGYVGATLE